MSLRNDRYYDPPDPPRSDRGNTAGSREMKPDIDTHILTTVKSLLLHHIGAAKAYDKKALETYGEVVYLNFPNEVIQ